MRPDGVAIADHDVGFLRDRKVAAAARRGGLQAIAAYLAVRDASWEEGSRVALEDLVDTLPGAYGVTLEELPLLVELELLDSSGRIPAETWSSWFDPVRERLDRRREAGRAGGLASGEARRAKSSAGTAVEDPSSSPGTIAERSLDDRSSNREPVRPSVRPSSVLTNGRRDDAGEREEASPRVAPPVQTPPETPPEQRTDCRRPGEHGSTSWFRYPKGVTGRNGEAWGCGLCLEEAKATDDRRFRDKVAAHGGPPA